MRRLAAVLIGVLSGIQLMIGQYIPGSAETDEKALFKSEARHYKMLMNAVSKPASDMNIDVKYYKLDLTITTSPNYLRGVVTMKAASVIGNLSAITLDLINAMTVDSVKAGTTRLLFAQQPSTLTITLNRTYGNGEIVAMAIYYHGVPVSTGWGSFTFGTHGRAPWVYTVSQPYGARDWWPCKDHPIDKADSVDIWVTADSSCKVGANGKLVAVINNSNGTKTHRWAERHPISTYLVSFALTDFAEFTNWFVYAGQSMPVLNYVLPEHLSNAQSVFPKSVDMLRIYSDKYSLYPFIDEKYGHSEINIPVAMENQTMTSLPIAAFTEYLVAHELAHMWFGDMITCANWRNIWLNEGFAEYSPAVYYEGMYGTANYWSYMNTRMNNAKKAAGSMYVRDTTNIDSLFDGNLVYYKGATVLHMLRHVLGDSVFFRSIRAYANDPRVRFGVATTENFRQVCESVSGTQLGYFFNEWIYGEKYPTYRYSWRFIPDPGGGYRVPIRIQQTTGTTNPVFFTMPIDCRLSGTGWDTTFVLWNNLADQNFEVHVSRLPNVVQLDPDNWILKATNPQPPITGAKRGVMYAISDTLYSINTQSGVATRVGWSGPELIDGLAIRDTALFGVSGGTGFSKLFKISCSDGLKAEQFSVPVSNLRSIAFGRGDTLFGAAAGQLYRLDLNAGTASLIGTAPRFIYAGLTYRRAQNELWATGRHPSFNRDTVYKVNQSTGALTLVGVTGDDNITPSIAFDSSDVLYGLKGAASDTSRLIRINTSNGTGTLVGSTRVFNLQAIAIRTDPTTSAHEQRNEMAPLSFSLHQNYPNPFNPTTTINYELPTIVHVSLKIFDVLGREAATLVNGQKSPGTYTVEWDASGFSSGVYLYRLQAGAFVETKKCLVLR